MNRFLLFLFAALSVSESSIAQCDTAFPIMVALNVEKEYTVRLDKSHYSNQIAWGLLDIRTDSVDEHRYDVNIKLKNISSKRAFIWLMSCSWFENFLVNNDYMYMGMIECSRNIPQCLRFEPGETKLFETTLSKSVKFENPCRNCSYGPQVQTTKLGLIVIDDVFSPKLLSAFDYYAAFDDKSTWKIIWSNSLYLLK